MASCFPRNFSIIAIRATLLRFLEPKVRRPRLFLGHRNLRIIRLGQLSIQRLHDLSVIFRSHSHLQMPLLGAPLVLHDQSCRTLACQLSLPSRRSYPPFRTHRCSISPCTRPLPWTLYVKVVSCKLSYDEGGVRRTLLSISYCWLQVLLRVRPFLPPS